MTWYACLFEAKAIQSYLFDSGRLRDVIGASEVVDALTGNLLDDALGALGIAAEENLRFSRRAGGAFYAFTEDKGVIGRFHALWTLLVQQYAPGLAYDIGSGEGETAMAAFDNARKALRADSSRQRPLLPAAAPVTERNRRTGMAAAVEDNKDGRIDVATAHKKRSANLSQAGFIERFSPAEANLGWRDWPRNLEAGEEGAFPFQGEDRTVALIHADGNGLGQLLMNARQTTADHPERFVEIFRMLSQGIEYSTRRAAQAATSQVLMPKREGDGRPLPARPILLGGDDLTILVRADLALPFLCAFVEAFETDSARAMSELRALDVQNPPERLTAGAGLVYLRASQPFYLATRLAESLMDAAKCRAKDVDRSNPPSALAFYRVTSTLVDNYEPIVKQELSHREGGAVYVDTLGAYFLGGGTTAPRLDELLSLQILLESEGMARGPTRQLLTLIGHAPDQARMRYRRWRQLMKDHRGAQLDQFDQLLKALVSDADPGDDLPYGPPDDQGRRFSPLGDVLSLMSAGNPAEWKQPQDAGKVI